MDIAEFAKINELKKVLMPAKGRGGQLDLIFTGTDKKTPNNSSVNIFCHMECIIQGGLSTTYPEYTSSFTGLFAAKIQEPFTLECVDKFFRTKFFVIHRHGDNIKLTHSLFNIN
jgi:hypothetical protein